MREDESYVCLESSISWPWVVDFVSGVERFKFGVHCQGFGENTVGIHRDGGSMSTVKSMRG